MKTFLAKLRCRKIFMFVTNWMILESKGKEFSKYSLLKQIKLLVFYCSILCNSEVTKYPTIESYNFDPALGDSVHRVITATYLLVRKVP